MQFTGLDIVAEAGAFVPLVKEFTFVPSGPTMVIELVSVKDNALINGIEVYSREVINTQAGAHPFPSYLCSRTFQCQQQRAACTCSCCSAHTLGFKCWML